MSLSHTQATHEAKDLNICHKIAKISWWRRWMSLSERASALPWRRRVMFVLCVDRGAELGGDQSRG